MGGRTIISRLTQGLAFPIAGMASRCPKGSPVRRLRAPQPRASRED